MKKRFSIFSTIQNQVQHLVLVLLFVTLLCGCNAGKERSIVILYENDAHCVLDGYARLRGLADAVSDTSWVGLTS
ncbi:MAG: hypothetical protein IKW22_01780, partial [Bacteroidaceae bacterium]|nr:hypothetical protein [Bacteroidaceae bacterium]